MTDDVHKRIQEVTRVIMHDPEKFSAHAQSGRAMEILNEPMVELIDEYRIFSGTFLKSLVIKLIAIFVIFSKRGEIADIEINPSYVPKSLDMELEWASIFPMTIEDLHRIADLYTKLTTNNILSRETALMKMAVHFDIEDIPAEVRRVETQKEFSGGFF